MSSMSQPVRLAKLLCLAFLAIADAGLILRCVAAGLAFPRMTNDVPSLVVLPVTGLLEYQVFRKMLAVIANVQSRDEYVLRRCWRDLAGLLVVSTYPEYAELTQLLGT